MTFNLKRRGNNVEENESGNNFQALLRLVWVPVVFLLNSVQCEEMIYRDSKRFYFEQLCFRHMVGSEI